MIVCRNVGNGTLRLTSVSPSADLLFLHMMLSLCVCTTPQSMSLHRSPGRRRGGSKVQKSRVAFKRSFRLVGETSIVQGNFAFSGCQMSKIFSGSASGRRGHAPHGRRGQVFCSTVKKCDFSIPSAENGLGAGVKLRTAVTLFARVREQSLVWCRGVCVRLDALQG